MSDIVQKLKDSAKTGKPVVLAFFGDSVTAGCFEDGAADEKAVYHTVLGEMLRERAGAAVKTLNFGIGGDNAAAGLKRIGAVIEAKPDLCAVAFGLNDAPAGEEHLSDYEEAMSAILSGLSAAGIEAVVLTPNMMNARPAALSCPHYQISLVTAKTVTSGLQERYSETAKAVAARHGAPVADCFSVWKKLWKSGVDTDAMLSNGVNHPTREAHGLFAEELLKILTGE